MGREKSAVGGGIVGGVPHGSPKAAKKVINVQDLRTTLGTPYKHWITRSNLLSFEDNMDLFQVCTDLLQHDGVLQTE